MSTIDEVTSWQGKTMVDAEGHKIATIEAIYGDWQGRTAPWAPAWSAYDCGA